MIDNIFTIGIVVLVLIFIWIIIHFYIKKWISRFLNLKELDIKNKKHELYSNIDPDTVNTVINNYFEEFINKYMLYKFVAPKAIHIKQKDLETMIKDVTRDIVINISDLYIYYIGLVQEINNQEDLIKFVNSRVTDTCINVVSNYNSME